jgi:hypothetical protein
MTTRLAAAIALCTALALTAGAAAREIEGLQVPESHLVDGLPLALNGAGVRSVKLGPFAIKAYVAAFYATGPVRAADAALDGRRPLRLDFTFLRAVSKADVAKAWNAQFRASLAHDYPELAADQAAFVGMFGPLQRSGAQSVEMVGEETRVYEGALLKGVIHGRDFQRAFLGLWFGPKPPTTRLREELLGG